jgi:hypothetical protein
MSETLSSDEPSLLAACEDAAGALQDALLGGDKEYARLHVKYARNVLGRLNHAIAKAKGQLAEGSESDKPADNAPITEEWFWKTVGHGSSKVHLGSLEISLHKRDSGQVIVMVHAVGRFPDGNGGYRYKHTEVVVLETIGDVRSMCQLLRSEIKE